MNFDQQTTLKVAKLIERTWNTELPKEDRKTHAAVLLAEEAAEFLGVYKKMRFSNRPDLDPALLRAQLETEYGDVMYALIVTMAEFELDADVCFNRVLAKLEARYGTEAS